MGVSVEDHHHQGLVGEAPDEPFGGRDAGEKHIRTTWTHGALDDICPVGHVVQVQPFMAADFRTLEMNRRYFGEFKEVGGYRDRLVEVVARLAHRILFHQAIGGELNAALLKGRMQVERSEGSPLSRRPPGKE